MANKKKAIALGFFDGVHVGHAALLNKVKERAAEADLVPGVLSFDVHPDNLVFGKEVPLINSAKDREEIVRHYFGIDDVMLIHFNQSVMRMPWQDFAASIIEELNLGWIVVGHDFSFGYKGAGKAALLKEYCEQRGIGCDIIPAVTIDDVIVSSTYIRKLILDGEMEKANYYLGHPHILSDSVRSGYHLGTKIGTPTINMCFEDSVLIPKHGVYITKVYLENGSEYIAVTNVGVRPTVSEAGKVNVESHLLDFAGNLYGVHCKVEFYKYIREEQKFDNPQELARQILRDAETAKGYFRQ